MVGGDLCSIRKIDECRAGIFLCDVMGHGVRAALGTAIIRALVEELTLKEADPGQFLEHMNRVLLPILRQGDQFMFASACYMILDLSRGVVTYASAGHPAPIILEAAGEIRLLDAYGEVQGAALGINEDAEYRTMECVLEPGDTVVLYTDGIYEVEDEDQSEFGQERLLAAVKQHRTLPLSELLSSILADAILFSANGRCNDDVCLAGFQLKQDVSEK